MDSGENYGDGEFTLVASRGYDDACHSANGRNKWCFDRKFLDGKYRDLTVPPGKEGSIAQAFRHFVKKNSDGLKANVTNVREGHLTVRAISE